MNFHKSMLGGVNISNSWLNEATTILSCKVGKMSFVYLSLPNGGDLRRLMFCEPIVSRIENRLYDWKSLFFFLWLLDSS